MKARGLMWLSALTAERRAAKYLRLSRGSHGNTCLELAQQAHSLAEVRSIRGNRSACAVAHHLSFPPPRWRNAL